jgi:hypothetical protein
VQWQIRSLLRYILLADLRKCILYEPNNTRRYEKDNNTVDIKVHSTRNKARESDSTREQDGPGGQILPFKLDIP